MTAPRPPLLSPDAFLVHLNRQLEGVPGHGFRAHGLVRQRSRWVMLLVSTASTAVQEALALLASPEARGWLTGWSDEELLVYVLGDRWDYSVLTATVQGRELMLVSDAITAPTHAPPPPPAEAPASPAPSPSTLRVSSRSAQRRAQDRQALHAWFEELVEAPLPVELDLVQLDANLWGSENTRGRELFGRRWLPRIYKLRNYTLFGFAGYGSSSYAVFLTRRCSATEMMLRLAWGSAYGDPENDRRRLLADLSEANHLFELAAAKRRPMHFCIDMGECRFDTRPIPHGLSLGLAAVPSGSFEDLRAYLGVARQGPPV